MLVVAMHRRAYVDLSERTEIALTVVLTFGYVATDAAVYFLVFVHHIKIPPFKVKGVCANPRKIIDIFENLL